MRSAGLARLLVICLIVASGRVTSSYLPVQIYQQCNVEVLRNMCMDVEREVCQTITEVRSH